MAGTRRSGRRRVQPAGNDDALDSGNKGSMDTDPLGRPADSKQPDHPGVGDEPTRPRTKDRTRAQGSGRRAQGPPRTRPGKAGRPRGDGGAGESPSPEAKEIGTAQPRPYEEGPGQGAGELPNCSPILGSEAGQLPASDLTTEVGDPESRRPEAAEAHQLPGETQVPPLVSEAAPALQTAEALLSSLGDQGDDPIAVAGGPRGSSEKQLVSPSGGQLLWTAAVCLSSSVGLGLVAIADAASRQGDGKLSFLFWLGLLGIFVPTAHRSLSGSCGRSERLLLALMLGSAMYLVKVAAAPTGFSFIDEFIHLRTLQDILRTHHLFTFNPLLAASSVYPGLETVTSAIADMTGLSPFVAGLLLVGVARLVFTASFFYVAEQVTGSSRAAAGATLVYASNPMFLFWSAYFSYENLALPLAAFVVWWIATTRRQPGRGPLLVGAVGVVAVTVTHHVAGFALAAVLVAWWVAERIVRGTQPAVRRLGWMAALSLVVPIGWMATIARPAIAYLWSENIYPGISQTVALVQGHLAARTLYSSAGSAAPLWERLAGFGGVAILLLLLPIGVYYAWTKHSSRPALLVAAGVAALYPLSLIPRLAPDGVAISGRSSEYLYAGLGCILGMVAAMASGPAARQHQTRWLRWLFRLVPGKRRAGLAVTAVLTVVFLGGVTVGTPYNKLLPEPANPVGYPSAVQPDVFAAAAWARTNLGPGRTFATDALDAPVLGSFGEQNPISENLAFPIFFSSTMSQAVVHDIRSAGVDYIFVDTRMSLGTPINPSYYFSPYEPGGSHHAHPLPSSYWAKFGATSCTSLVYFAGPLRIYDVTAIADGLCVPAIRAG